MFSGPVFGEKHLFIENKVYLVLKTQEQYETDIRADYSLSF